MVQGCTCTPRVKEYLQRVVEDVEGKRDLLYVKYQCTDTERSCYSAISPEYLQSQVYTIVHFPFITGTNTGYLKVLPEMVHNGIMYPNGLTITVAGIRRRRQVRFCRLYSLFADRIWRLRARNANYIAPSSPTVGKYCADNSLVDSKVLMAVWMETTAI
ncbi:hypothetical protein BBJ28_00020829 [Nothophytophthora sp. Chile5]|nr:hypothetical protein BBJ28_00020829 [Nothophytophthora sp. Chile5]